MADVEIPHAPEPRALPQVMVGIASPLWAYFGAAAAGGLAYWWMTRWTRPVNLEAMFAPVGPAVDAMVEAVEEVAELPFAAVDAIAALEAQPVVEIAAEPAAEPEGEPVLHLPPVAETDPELAAASDAPVEAESVAEPEPLLRVVPPVEAEAEPLVEAAAEPEVTPGFEAAAEEEPAAPKPKARKAAPSKG